MRYTVKISLKLCPQGHLMTNFTICLIILLTLKYCVMLEDFVPATRSLLKVKVLAA